MDTRPPQGLVGVDVPHACEGALIEEHSLDRRAPRCQPFAQPPGVEPALERLPAKARREVWLELVRLDEQPGAEAADVPVRDVRPVV